MARVSLFTVNLMKDVSMKRLEEAYDLGRYTESRQHFPDKFSRYTVESFDQVKEHNPGLQPMFLRFFIAIYTMNTPSVHPLFSR